MMTSDATDVGSHLRDDTTFKTYADERLAMLYLQNSDNFRIDMLIKVFDVILDPLFKLEDITFKSAWDIFSCISDYQRRRSRPIADDEQLEAEVVVPDPHTCSVPPLAVSLVVDSMMGDRTSLGTVAEKGDWRDAYESNIEDFHAMSLVHSTWIPIARRALQHRVIVPYNQINNFLLSPLCGPWVMEMAVYWTINNGFEGATSSDVDLFQALLERTPRLQSLAFVTKLYRHDKQRDVDRASSSQFSRCLEHISDVVPNLENLWLKHIWQGRVGLTASLRTCDDVDSLSRLLSNLRSLKFFFMHSWNTLEQVHIERHPKLQTVEVHNIDNKIKSLPGTTSYLISPSSNIIKALYWSRAPGGGLIKASGLSCRTIVLKHVPASELSGLAKLELKGACVGDLPEALHHCTSLVHLKSSYCLAIGIRENLMNLLPRSALDSRIIYEHIRSLPRLRRLVLSDFRLDFYELQDLMKSLKYSGLTPPSEREGRTTPLVELCKERGIEFVLESREGSIRVC